MPAELCALNLNEVFFQGYVSNANGDQDADDDTPDTGGAEQIIINGVSVPVRREDGSGRGRFLRSKAFDVEDAYNERQLVQGYSGVRDGCNSIACPPGYFSNGNGEDGVFPCEQCDHEYLNPYLGAKSCFVLDQVSAMYSHLQCDCAIWNCISVFVHADIQRKCLSAYFLYPLDHAWSS